MLCRKHNVNICAASAGGGGGAGFVCCYAFPLTLKLQGQGREIKEKVRGNKRGVVKGRTDKERFFFLKKKGTGHSLTTVEHARKRKKKLNRSKKERVRKKVLTQ